MGKRKKVAPDVGKKNATDARGRSPWGGMALMTQEIARSLPPRSALYDGAFSPPMLWARYFNPIGGGTWYLAAGSPDKAKESRFGDDDFFCLGCATFDGDSWEWGEFSIKELESFRLPLGLHIERDLGFMPRMANKVREIASLCTVMGWDVATKAA